VVVEKCHKKRFTHFLRMQTATQANFQHDNHMSNSMLGWQVSELQSTLESKAAEMRQLEKTVEGLNEAKRQMSKSREEMIAQLQSLQVRIICDGSIHNIIRMPEMFFTRAKGRLQSRRTQSARLDRHEQYVSGLFSS
jgi:hypothetical protein